MAGKYYQISFIKDRNYNINKSSKEGFITGYLPLLPIRTYSGNFSASKRLKFTFLVNKCPKL